MDSQPLTRCGKRSVSACSFVVIGSVVSFICMLVVGGYVVLREWNHYQEARRTFPYRAGEVKFLVDAIHEYYLDHGEWPSSIDSLGSHYVDRPVPEGWQYWRLDNASDPVLFLAGPNRMRLMYVFSSTGSGHESGWSFWAEGTELPMPVDAPSGGHAMGLSEGTDQGKGAGFAGDTLEIRDSAPVRFY